MVRTKTTPLRTKLFTCAICLAEQIQALAATLECHPSDVCRVCLRRWFNESHSCPICRAEVTSHEAVYGSQDDFDRAKRRQERRRQRLLRIQAEHDARLARQLEVREVVLFQFFLD